MLLLVVYTEVVFFYVREYFSSTCLASAPSNIELIYFFVCK